MIAAVLVSAACSAPATTGCDKEINENESFTLVPPFYYSRQEPFEKDLFVFPLWVSLTRGCRTDTYPLFPVMRYTGFDRSPERGAFKLFPLVEHEWDGMRHRLLLGDLTPFFGVFKLLDTEWGIPGREGGQTGGVFSFVNVLDLFRVAGGGDPGGYDDLQILTLFSMEKLSLYQHHWKKGEADEGRTVFFPLFSRSKGVDMVQWGVLADIIDFEKKGSEKKLTVLWFIPFSWGSEHGCDSEENE